jgi:hypothetical protein
MNDDVDDLQPDTANVEAIAALTEEITGRLEAGEPVTDGDMGVDPEQAGPIRQLLPTLRAMVALGDQLAREDGSQSRSQRKSKRPVSSSLDTTAEEEELKP